MYHNFHSNYVRTNDVRGSANTINESKYLTLSLMVLHCAPLQKHTSFHCIVRQKQIYAHLTKQSSVNTKFNKGGILIINHELQYGEIMALVERRARRTTNTQRQTKSILMSSSNHRKAYLTQVYKHDRGQFTSSCKE